MAFTRDELETYEKGPQKQISDKVSPFRGATPAKAADAASIAAVAAGQVDATPGGTVAQAAVQDPLVDDSPIVDEDGTLGDPTDSGEGTSDVNSEDSSDSAVDPSDETDPNTDLTGEPTGEEPEARPAPKKGSAAERIVETLDLAEGYKVFGKQMQDQLIEANAEIARLRGGNTPPPPPPVVDKDEPMPDLSDEDIGFDNDKYRAKMAKWVKTQGRLEARRELREMTGADAEAKVKADVDAKCTAYMKIHPEFKKVVTENKVLAANLLAPDAGFAVAQSEHTAELLMRFGKDDALAIRTAKQSPAQQLITIGRMIGEIEAEQKVTKVPSNDGKNPQGGAKPAQKKSITQAPPPPRATPASGRPAGRDVLDPAMDMNEFARQHRSGKQSARAQSRKMRGLDS